MGGLVASVIWYAAALLTLLSLLALVRPAVAHALRRGKPVRRLGMRARRGALALLGASILTILVLAGVPVRITMVAAPTSRLDAVAPIYHYAEAHARHVNAPPERVYAAMKLTTAGEIKFFQTFTWIRRFGRPGPENILNAPERLPILDVATRSGFVLLADDPPRELVVGTVVVAPRSARGKGPLTAELYPQIQAPGFVKAAMNFRITPEGAGARITTETRVIGTDPGVIRRFTPYWRTILPGSWILRATWLDAIARRAESNKELRPKN